MFGNTHFNLGKQVIEQSKIMLSEREKEAFLSGLVYADIGRFTFDKEIGIDSDSDEFVLEMKNHIENREEEWFVRGFEMHVLQDRETSKFLKNVFSHEYTDYSQYMMDCALLDCYFLKKNNSYVFNDYLNKFNFDQVSSSIDIKNLSEVIGIPEDKMRENVYGLLDQFYYSIDRNSLIIYDELIIKTYHSLGLEISSDDIYEQAANIVGAFAISSSIAQKQELPKYVTDKIELESDRLVKLCMSDLKL